MRECRWKIDPRWQRPCSRWSYFMRGIVIAKMFVLILWGTYLAIGLTQADGERNSARKIAAAIHCPVQ